MLFHLLNADCVVVVHYDIAQHGVLGDYYILALDAEAEEAGRTYHDAKTHTKTDCQALAVVALSDVCADKVDALTIYCGGRYAVNLDITRLANALSTLNLDIHHYGSASADYDILTLRVHNVCIDNAVGRNLCAILAVNLGHQPHGDILTTH